MKRFWVTAILTAACMALTTCDGPVGLGEKILMNGPVVTIGEPVPNREILQSDPIVGTLFMLSGTARDELRVTSLTVTLDYWNTASQELVRMERAWRWEGKWLTRESDGAPWRPYTDADYNLADAGPEEETITPPAWSVYNRNDARWSLPLFMNRMEKGEYFITVSAWNAAGRHDAKSAAKLKIRYNNQAPTIKITNPILLDGGGSLAEPQPPSWDGYVFDPFNRPEETSLNLRYFTNSFHDLGYQIEDPIAPAVDLSLEIANPHNLDSFGDEKIAYYQWQWDQGDGALPSRGIFTDKSGAIGAPIDTYKKAGNLIELGGAVENTLPRDSVTPMQLVTRVRDATGLEEYKSKGWFLYLPDSDKPYSDINFAHKVAWDADVPPDAPERASMTRGSTNYNNLAYDDDGVREMQWTLYRLSDTNLATNAQVDSGIIAFEGGKRETWSFNANKNYGTGRFKFVARVQDIYGAWGDEYHGYFTITSNATPTIVTPLDSPGDLTATFWGDSSGNFTIAGRAQIEDYDDCDGIEHGVRVHEVAIVWLKPGLGVENNFRYSDPNDAGWDAPSDTVVYTDAHGNKRWKTSVAFVDSTVGNGSANFQEEWAFSRTLNYFTDLGIGMGAGKLPFNEQQFRIRATGGEVTGERRSSVYSFTARGDMAAPAVDITHVVIRRGAVEVSYSIGGYNTLPTIAENDEVMLAGLWSDDSIAAWTGLGASRHTEYLSALDVQWDGEANQFKFDIESFTLDSAGGGSWQTGWHAFAAHNTDPIIQLTATLTDIGARPGTGTAVLVVETADPVLVRISSALGDGYYGEHKPTVADDPDSRHIDLFLEFNKPVTFLPDSGAPALTYNNAPRLVLNNGGEAFYLSGVGTSRIMFRYFVNGVVNPPLNTALAGRGGGNSPAETANPEGRLNVASVNFNGFGESAWKSLTNNQAVFQKDGNRLRVCDPANIFSLAGQKRIIIDKTPPAITGVATFATRAQNHGIDSQINIEVIFNKNITVTGATPANTFLGLAGGNLDSQQARAAYDQPKDSRTLNFLYTVADGDDTSAYGQFLAVASAVFGGTVLDLAGNALPPWPAIPGSPAFLDGIVIDTVPPEPPLIFGVNSNQNYYSETNFYIGGLEPGGGMVEYHLNYPTSGEPATGWTTYTGVISGGQTGPIPLTLDGAYTIVARQHDTATTPNRSPLSAAVGPVRIDKGPILERLRSSLPDGAYAHAVPGKDTITIDMEFRLPVTLAGGDVDGASVALNTSGGATNLARLSSAPASSKKWTFEYVIPQGAGTPPNTYLEVTALDLDGITIVDGYGTRLNGPNGWIHLGDLSTENKFSSQKKMTVLAGRPYVVNPELGYGIVFTGTQLRLEFDRDIYRGKTTEKLMIRQIDDGFKIPAVLSEEQFNGAFINREDIFTDQGGLFVVAPPLGNGFLSLADVAAYNTWPDGQGRRADAWRSLGNKLYQTGYNGATLYSEGSSYLQNELHSDTTPKYILYYDADPDDDGFTDQVNISGATKRATMNLLRVAFRASEALTFKTNDREVTMSGSTLTIDLSASGRPLPVKGARYEWVFPNGFLQDALGTANGTGDFDDAAPVGIDANLTSGNTPDGERVLFYASAAEPPTIRVDKGDDVPAFTDSTVNRHALQPLTSRVKINSRMPNAAVTYWVRQSMQKLYFRPITGTIILYGEDDESKWPSGIVHFQTDQRLSISPDYDWVTGNSWGAARNYAQDFAIGSENYSDGGMVINIRARSTATGVTNTPDDYGYESAYRSVLIYNNYPASWLELLTHYNGAIWLNPGTGLMETLGPVDAIHFNNETTLLTDLPTANLHLLERSAEREIEILQRQGGGAWVNSPVLTYNNTYSNSGRDRVWIVGGNTHTGDTSIPDFPLSRNLAQSRKTGLLTPLDINAVPQYTRMVFSGSPQNLTGEIVDHTVLFYGYTLDDTEPTLTAANIPAGPVGTGHYLWAWVTWNLNVTAYVELLYGELPSNASDPYQTPRTNLRYVLSSPEHTTHAMIPGETTLVGEMPWGVFRISEYSVYPQDPGGHNFHLGDPFPAPPRSD